MPSTSWNPDKDIPLLSGKVILITGGTAGLGTGSIEEFAKHSPSHIVFTGRKQKSADAVIANIAKVYPSVQLTFIKCDLTSFASVKEAAYTFKSQFNRLDIFMANAGIMAVPPAVSKDGYEIQWATNFLSQALLIKLLMPILESTAAQPDSDVRIVQLSSMAYQQAPCQGIDFATLKSDQNDLGSALWPGHRWARYGQTKVAQILYAKEFAKHHPNIISVAVHPGVVYGTNLFEGLPLMTRAPAAVLSKLMGMRIPLEQGHWNQVWASTCRKDQIKSGAYYEPFGQLVTPATKAGKDDKLAEQLWEWTEKELEPVVKG